MQRHYVFVIRMDLFIWTLGSFDEHANRQNNNNMRNKNLISTDGKWKAKIKVTWHTEWADKNHRCRFWRKRRRNWRLRNVCLICTWHLLWWYLNCCNLTQHISPVQINLGDRLGGPQHLLAPWIFHWIGIRQWNKWKKVGAIHTRERENITLSHCEQALARAHTQWNSWKWREKNKINIVYYYAIFCSHFCRISRIVWRLSARFQIRVSEKDGQKQRPTDFTVSCVCFPYEFG